jgi:hypothetical protein
MFAQEVEFIGGPLDGHRHRFTEPPAWLPSLATPRISPDVVRVVTGAKRRAVAPPTSTAVYCLDGQGDEWRYYHVASIAVQPDHEFDAARG